MRNTYKYRLPRKRRGLWAGLLLCAAAVLWFALAPSGREKSKGPPPVPVKVALPERRDVALTLREVGAAVAYETVSIRSRLDSQVIEVAFKDGDAVRKGDLLFVLDDRMLKAQIGQLDAALQRDRAQLENVRRQFQRAESLSAKGFASASARDDAKSAYAAQRASVGASEAALESVKVQLGYTRIVAPISGRTGTINVTAGNTVKANDAQPLVTINQVRPIRVQTSLPQSALDAVRAAMRKGKVEVIAARQDGGVCGGVLEYIDNEVDRSTGTFAARAHFPNDDEQLWPGMFVNLSLNLGDEKQALVIPEVAVRRGQEGDYVFAVECANTEGGAKSAPCKAIKRNLRISRVQDGFAVIATGLRDGERVAVDGLMDLRDGGAVTVQDSANGS